MSESEFDERIAKIRARFVTKFAEKLRDTDAAVSQLTGDGADATAATEATYRRFHDMCGIGSTIGLNATGQAAKALDAILIAPFRAQRGLSSEELVKFKGCLEALRAAGQSEMGSMAPNAESAT